MFEKYAEEYTKKKFRSFVKGIREIARISFKDGAEFGYQKGLEFGVKSNEKVNQIVANEWHNLEKNPNDLPENERNVWCYYGDGYGKGHYDKDSKGWWIEGHLYCSAIDAWCELPKYDKGE